MKALASIILVSIAECQMSVSEQAVELLISSYGSGSQPHLVSVPGRINLIGEHVDYHGLPVLPLAIQRRVSVAFLIRPDALARAVSSVQPGSREFALASQLQAEPAGDWANYLKAAAVALQTRWQLTRGIDAAVSSDLPAAAGLSSSSALLAGFAIALLQANEIQPTMKDLMTVLPEGEHFVGTRGGGMDHAAVLAARRGHAVLIRFAPLEFSHIPIPSGWVFLVAHSLSSAEKSGAVRAQYNALRENGMRGLQAAGLPSYRAALEQDLDLAASKISDTRERAAFLHVVGEAMRVQQAVTALQNDDKIAFGQLLAASHESLRNNLGVSTPRIDALVETAMDAGALGARLTGAGFGGCAIILCTSATCRPILDRLIHDFYSTRSEFDPETHLFRAEPSAGALAPRDAAC